MLTEKFLSVNVQGLDLSGDESLSQNAERLEDISLKVQAVKTLLDTDPEFESLLKAQEPLYDRFMRQMNALGRLSDHYRVRKLVMTDPYYLSHYNDEIGLSADKEKADAEQEALSALLSMSRETAAALKNFMDGKDEEQWAEKGTSAVIKALEEKHKTRALASGRLDLNLITKENMQKIMLELKKFRGENIGLQMRDTTLEELRELSKGYSPEFRDYLVQMKLSGDRDNLGEIVEGLVPGVQEKLRALDRVRSDDNRFSAFQSHMDFNDPVSGDHYEYSSHSQRDYAFFAQGGAGQMMSPEEILEMYENVNLSVWKDYDSEDPKEAAAAKEIYLANMGKLYEVMFNHLQRVEHTYGFLPAQMSTIAFMLAANGKLDMFANIGFGTVSDDLIKKMNSVVGGQEMTMAEVLVLKGYLSKDYLDKVKETSDLESALTMRITNGFTTTAQIFTGMEELKDFEFDSLGDTVTCESINSHRGKTEGPAMTAEEEKKCWFLSTKVAAATGMPEQDKTLQASGIRALQANENYIYSMAQLKRYIDNLAAVDTRGHSNKYKRFSASLKRLTGLYSRITKNCPPDGKNLDPQSLMELQKAYRETIGLAGSYLENKNRSHRNAIYRRRYDIVEELIQTLEKDYSVLQEKTPDRSYNLEEAVDESREAVINLSEADIEVISGSMSERNVFTTEINGEKRRMVFTKRNELGPKDKKKLTDQEKRDIIMYKKYGIPVGANLDKRNVAMSLMSEELDTKENIAYSTMAKVGIKDEDGHREKSRGTLMEYIEGLNIDEVGKGFHSGDIVADNEAKIIEQLSDIQVTDYLCGNVDRHMGNMMFVMEETGKINEATKKPVLRIKRIVGIDNDLSFGTMFAKNLNRHTKRMSIPDTMQFISRHTAEQVLSLQKEPLFLKLGATVTEEEKEAMWSRVENLQLAIMNSGVDKKKAGLNVVESFEEYSLKDIADANLEQYNIYRMFYSETGYLGEKKRIPDIDDIPHRLNVKEVRMDIVANKVIKDTKGSARMSLEAADLYLDYMQMSSKKLNKTVRKSPKAMLDFVMKLFGSSQEFNSSVGRQFDCVSTLPDYSTTAGSERMNLFSNDYAKMHGVNSILDVFYIDGKPAREEFPYINEMVNMIMSDRQALQFMVGKPVKTYEDEVKYMSFEYVDSFRDMVAKALIMSCLVSGKKQVTIANYQKNKEGKDELVITDLNAVIQPQRNVPLRKEKLAGHKDNEKLIENSRKKRKERFDKIRSNVDKRMNKK